MMSPAQFGVFSSATLMALTMVPMGSCNASDSGIIDAPESVDTGDQIASLDHHGLPLFEGIGLSDLELNALGQMPADEQIILL